MEKNILLVPFWKIALRFTLVFIVVFSVMMLLIQYFQYRNFDALSESLSDGSWISYVAQKIGLALVYGVAMAYFSRKKAQNNSNLKRK